MNIVDRVEIRRNLCCPDITLRNIGQLSLCPLQQPVGKRESQFQLEIYNLLQIICTFNCVIQSLRT